MAVHEHIIIHQKSQQNIMQNLSQVMTSMGRVFEFFNTLWFGVFKKDQNQKNCLLQVFENVQNQRTMRSRYLKKFRFKESLVPGISKSSKNCWVS
jgi:hypothetical protein